MSRWRGEQSGSLKRKKTGWFARWREYIEKDGKIVYDQVTKKIGDKEMTKAEAQQELRARLQVANGPASIRQTIATFQQFIDIRFRPEHMEHLERNTKIQHESLLKNHILPTFGKLRLREITKPLVQAWVNGKAKQTSFRTCQACYAILRTALNFAEENGCWRGPLPTRKVKLPKPSVVRTPIALTEVQVNAVLGQLDEPARTLVLLVVLTGMRVGEAVALDWAHVNLTDEPRLLGRETLPGRTIAVRKNFTAGEMKSAPKTPAGCRNIPIIPVLWMALFAIRQDSGLVLRNKNGEPLDAHNIANRKLAPACIAVGLPRLGFHVFRHTLSTLAQQKGMSVAEARDVLGHATNAMTMKYTHGSLDRARESMSKLDIGGKVQ